MLPYRLFPLSPVDRVHVLKGLSPSPDGHSVVRSHFLLALVENTSLSAFNDWKLAAC